MKRIITIVVVAVLIASCSKEYSVENTTTPNYTAVGSLLDDAGNCKPVVVLGNYKENVALTTENLVQVSINFSAIGNFFITTDTVNGMWFNTQSYAYTTGTKVINLQGYGKPVLAQDANFIVHLDTSYCAFTVKNGATVSGNTNTDYFPTTNNSNWTYYNSVLNDTALVTIKTIDKTINGNSYRQFEIYVPLLGAKDTLFYRKDGAGNYYRYYAIGSGEKADFIFLKDYVAIGTSWESPVATGILSGSPTPVKYKMTVTDKNITKTISSKTIDSIITVKEETQYLVSGSFVTKNIYVYDYAKKIGLVDVNQQNAVPNLSAPVRRWVVY